jgi:hypothetical protein
MSNSKLKIHLLPTPFWLARVMAGINPERLPVLVELRPAVEKLAKQVKHEESAA